MVDRVIQRGTGRQPAAVFRGGRSWVRCRALVAPAFFGERWNPVAYWDLAPAVLVARTGRFETHGRAGRPRPHRYTRKVPGG